LIPLGFASLVVVAYGLFKGKRWSWFVAVELSIMGVGVNAISLVTSNIGAITGALVGIAFIAIVLYYLSRRIVYGSILEKYQRQESQPLRALEIIKATWFRSFFPEPSNLWKYLR